MTIDESSRHHLHEAARVAFGDDAAITLMEMLPPVGWADVATKRDLDQLEDRLTMRFDARFERFETQIDARFDQVDARFGRADSRFDRLEERIDHLETRFDLKLDRWAAQIQNRMTMRFVGIAIAIVAATGALNTIT